MINNWKKRFIYLTIKLYRNIISKSQKIKIKLVSKLINREKGIKTGQRENNQLYKILQIFKVFSTLYFSVSLFFFFTYYYFVLCLLNNNKIKKWRTCHQVHLQHQPRRRRPPIRRTPPPAPPLLSLHLTHFTFRSSLSLSLSFSLSVFICK